MYQKLFDLLISDLESPEILLFLHIDLAGLTNPQSVATILCTEIWQVSANAVNVLIVEFCVCYRV